MGKKKKNIVGTTQKELTKTWINLEKDGHIDSKSIYKDTLSKLRETTWSTNDLIKIMNKINQIPLKTLVNDRNIPLAYIMQPIF